VRHPTYLIEFAFLRAVAIIAVVAIHATDPPVITGTAGPLIWPYIVIDVAAHPAVPLFIFVSGAILMHTHPPPVRWRGFVLHRLGRLLPAYLAVSIVYLIARAVSEGPPSVTEIVVRILTGTAYFHLWFVVLVVELTLLYPLLAPWVRTTRPSGLIRLGAPLALLASAYFLLKALLFLVQPDWVLSAVVLQGLAPGGYLLFFVAGMAVTAHADRVRRILERITPLRFTPVFLAALLLGAARFAASIQPSPVRLVLAGISFLVEPYAYLLSNGLLLRAAKDPLLTSRPRIASTLARLGGASYGIYLVQGGVIDLVIDALLHLGIEPANVAYLPTTVIATLALSWGAVELVGRGVRRVERGRRRSSARR
jgi:peptidoglycan/LPS O-acetylase OafA/YrhL